MSGPQHPPPPASKENLSTLARKLLCQRFLNFPDEGCAGRLGAWLVRRSDLYNTSLPRLDWWYLGEKREWHFFCRSPLCGAGLDVD